MGVYLKGFTKERYIELLRMAGVFESEQELEEFEKKVVEVKAPHGRLIDADELWEHVGRDRLDSRELIMKMVDKAPTVIEAEVE